MNIVFTGFTYPRGMASTKRQEHTLSALRAYDGVSARVVVLRQASRANALSGVHAGVPYETIGPDLFRLRFLIQSPLFFHRCRVAVRNLYAEHAKNILIVNGPPKFENVPLIRQARETGFKTVFDILEDSDCEGGVSFSIWNKATVFSTRHYTRQLPKLADGVLAVSSHLYTKMQILTQSRIPILLHPIGVDMSRFVEADTMPHASATLFYGGSFAVKDGVECLIEAFETLADRYPELHLVMTGIGEPDRMRSVLSRIAQSEFARRIAYKGYLGDEAYYRELMRCTIPCMTRTGSRFANAGFPFKLGEFLATGKPVVASNVSDISRYLKDREDALLVEPGSVKSIVRAIEFVLQNPVQANRVGKKGQQVALERFDYKKQGPSLYRFLSEL